MIKRFMNFRVKEYAKKKNAQLAKKRAKKRARMRARNYDRAPTLREYYNYFKYGDV